ncbi:hypothetical protein AwErysi_06570 [Erysipelotrichaceae bacterium]|nr:hypothetical protein AwErysi_06570 [Erysipelotrichaceae bacterium]
MLGSRILINLLKKPLVFLVIIAEFTIFYTIGYGLVQEYTQVSNEISLVETLTSKSDTLITIEKLQTKENINNKTITDLVPIESILAELKLSYNRVYEGGGFLSEAVTPRFETNTPKEGNYHTQVILATEQLTGEFIFSGGRNFSDTDFKQTGPYKVILGDAYRQKLAVGEKFTIDMKTGGGLGILELEVQGFLASKVLQPVLTNHLSRSTKIFEDYFIIAMAPTDNVSFQAPLYMIKTDEQRYEDLRHSVYSLEEKNFYIRDEFSHKKKAVANLEKTRDGLQLRMLTVALIYMFVLYMLSMQRYQQQRGEMACMQLLGVSKFTNWLVMVGEYAVIHLLAGLTFIGYSIILKGQVLPPSILLRFIVFSVLLGGLILIPVSLKLKNTTIYDVLKEEL